MAEQRSEIIDWLVAFFDQQKQLYGDGFILTNEQFAALRQSLAPGPGSMVKPVSNNDDVQISTHDNAKALAEFHHQIKDCSKCPLAKTRKQVVFGVGNPNADLMLIGEAPGAEEDREGEPFVGQAGQLLNKILKAINLAREEVYVANIIKCRPPGNRDPFPEEVEQCEPYLQHQIQVIRPKLILALGRIAGQTLLKTGDSLSLLRGKLHYYREIPLVVTFHPAALLRNPQWKYPTWDDVRYLRRVYDAILQENNPEEIQFDKR